jgi:hypothetical protein
MRAGLISKLPLSFILHSARLLRPAVYSTPNSILGNSEAMKEPGLLDPGPCKLC